MSARSLERLLFRWLPLLVLLVAFAGVAIQAGTPWPWNSVVHEDGSRTLLETTLYFEHATRELVPDIVLALAIAGSVRYFFPPGGASANPDAVRWQFRWAVAAATTLAVILLGTLRSGGAHAILNNLSQLHTRPGEPLVWGAHWRYHLIERGAEIMLAFSVAGGIWLLEGRPQPPVSSGRYSQYAIALAAFVGLTLLFGPTREPFRDPRFLGHQARELLTHTLVTLPLALGVCLGMARRLLPRSTRSAWPAWPIVVSGVLAVLSGGFLLVASMLTGAQSYGQRTSLAELIFPHFAEHTLGYLLVPSLAGLLYLWPGRIRYRSASGDGTRSASGEGK